MPQFEYVEAETCVEPGQPRVGGIHLAVHPPILPKPELRDEPTYEFAAHLTAAVLCLNRNSGQLDHSGDRSGQILVAESGSLKCSSRWVRNRNPQARSWRSPILSHQHQLADQVVVDKLVGGENVENGPGFGMGNGTLDQPPQRCCLVWVRRADADCAHEHLADITGNLLPAGSGLLKSLAH